MAENTAASGANNGFWKNFFEKTLPPEQQALIGMLSFFLIIVVVGYVGVTEDPRMTDFTAEFDARSIQRGAALFDTNCATCHGKEGQGTPGVAPALRNPDLFNGNRLAELGYAGSVRNFVELTIAAGRPARSGDWPQSMPTWSQEYGGPLRQDQVRDLTNFVMNWSCEFDEKCVSEDDVANLPTPAPTATAGPTPTLDPNAPAPVCAGEDCTPLAELPEGDVANGEALYLSTATDLNGTPLGCSGCHTTDTSTLVGPGFGLTATDVPDGYDSVHAYAYESILYPNAFNRSGTVAGLMPANFGERLSPQMLADLIAFIAAQGE